ncbi:alpha/beta fold hydrolase [Ulvibacter litoralis]|uniref:Pimeloyl-ACP methyl ester carboxylesterase n=1 Tax=Ulvibacter litoralis TaxID=227084 RepID=A0A1G7CXR9_9FLAO|nr:alpha/beta hydrolase [Ulvibacter litoralis]GHC45689.1 alpha/beta hydrolase [Ulvibacter litoralis]SDE44023.1 Pimeloyl-ACP methyl ester carboxylesterase [Ulvibacter litoralis]
MILNYNNASIYYEIHGEGPVLLLLHGFLESATMWEKFIPEVASKYTIITMDFPGHGKSECIDKEHTMELLAEVVHALLLELNINSVSIMGHSMGGYVALAFAEKYDEKLQKLALLNSTSAEDSADRKLNRERAIQVISRNPAAFISMAISNLFSENTHQKYASEIQNLKNEALKFPLEGILAAVIGMKNRKDRTTILKNFSKEKILICGKNDLIVPYETSKTLASHTLSKLIELDGGHMGMVENLKEITKIYT